MVKTMTVNQFLILASSESQETIKSIKDFYETTGDFFKVMSKVMYYLFHPEQLAWTLWCGLVAHSFEICLLLCLISIMAWIIGWNKGKKIAVGSMLFYGVVRAINVAL
ncbi:hypothetical protein ACJDU8_23785 [Clostridium sp. WILCCON 0269]|uniref:Uncharacterized protein n=1 Tax=Candidatus Clostridium eludens TaxID=3381663 RepID=A0ABW8SRV8_9CLOT